MGKKSCVCNTFDGGAENGKPPGNKRVGGQKKNRNFQLNSVNGKTANATCEHRLGSSVENIVYYTQSFIADITNN